MKINRFFTRLATLFMIISLAGVFPVDAAPSVQEGPVPIFSTPAGFDVSPPLNDLAAASSQRVTIQSGAVIQAPPNRKLFVPDNGFTGDEAIQEDSLDRTFAASAAKIPAPLLSFEGLSNQDNINVFGSGVTPPDPVGDVGKNHYVAMVNFLFAVYSKTGNLLLGPTPLGDLWAGFSVEDCSDSSGDPIVVYDQFADRWIVTQFTTRGPIYYNCVMVSVSGNPTGAYYRYAFDSPFGFPDYPKYGVWRNSYLITTNEFADAFGGPQIGVGVYALERSKMIRGRPNARAIAFFLDLNDPTLAPLGLFRLLPPDIDGNRLPSASARAPIIGPLDDGRGAATDALTIWELFVKWDDKPKASLDFAAQLPVAAFDSVFPCAPDPFEDCIPQPGVPTDLYLDILSDRPMWRLAYRNFGEYEALVTNQSVEARPGIAGIRWYEIRREDKNYSIRQQGTFAPNDGVHRWMASIAMDKKGNIALGYSVSNATDVFPGIRYTGRLRGDQRGKMTLGEKVIIDGSGVQTESSRWGDYSSMNIDPKDDCSFWYVNEYYSAEGQTIGWQTRISKFKLPGCSGGDD